MAGVTYPYYPAGVMSTPVTVLRAPLANINGYGPERDWANATERQTNMLVYASVNLLAATEQSSDKELTKTHWKAFAWYNEDVRAEDRIRWNSDGPRGVLTADVDGHPFVFHDHEGRPHHMEVKIKLLEGG